MGAVMAAEARYQQPQRATPENWMYPPADGWTYDQVKELVLPFDWELVDGAIVVRGMANQWHDDVRDGLLVALRLANRPPYRVNSERCVLVDEANPAKPDVIVFDTRDLDRRSMECVPVERVILAVEVVSKGSRTDDRFRKPGMYADAGISYFWRVERGDDDIPVVHEFWLHPEAGVYAPSPDRPTHVGILKTDVPFPVEIDLGSLIEV
ncbi:Uma2 family endonuclease [Streptomyces sp. SCA3-4]|uniref:Uma2 family endonuclease n=1 Tax=Streptomyces sichuanensis TaxID=2871810 RepID=UPI001CE34D7B|nr:Uma2 family endonuclease [Streptomyces sichuanensis]MCA6092301.1 Uma2 family endonuclease [Streptomyces sichuanensis]